MRMGLALVFLAQCAIAWAEARLDGAAVAWIGVVPVVGVMLQGPRSLLVWGPLSVGAMLVTAMLQPELVSGGAGFPFVPIARATVFVASMGTVALAFARFQEDLAEELRGLSVGHARFVASVSHELRTPMNALLGSSQLLRELVPAERRGRLEEIARAGETVLLGLDELLEAGRSDGDGEGPPAPAVELVAKPERGGETAQGDRPHGGETAPGDRERRGATSEEAGAPGRVAPGGERVLVVDGNAINLRIACAMLRNAGYEVHSACNGVEAVEAAQSCEPRLILMDRHMPVMDGLEATRRIRQLPAPLRSVPIVALTAAALPDELVGCIEAGMNATLTKPVKVEQLLAVVERYRGQAR